ncbi:LUD domain-containing protein, partial (plasmid) [Chromobacterium amazonense]|uniref:LutC/YkgG family protein n=1 Tax=Chromobacterium amazonense TaxID=1382803 RepID=UPI00237D9C0A
ARGSILQKLRAAPRQERSRPDLAGHFQHFSKPDDEVARLRHWAAMMRAVKTEILWTREAEWDADLAGWLAAHPQDSILLSDTPHGRKLAQRLEGVDKAPRIVWFDRDVDGWKPELFDVAAGFTAVRCGIAATGTLALWPDEAEPRTMSLVPPLHIALFDTSTLYPDFYSAMKGENWAAGMPTRARPARAAGAGRAAAAHRHPRCGRRRAMSESKITVYPSRAFKDNAKLALTDDKLRQSLRGAMDFLMAKRLASFPDPAELAVLRTLGEGIRQRCLSRLPDLLELLEEKAAFRVSHADLLDGLAQLSRQLAGDPPLAERVRRKYRLKNTTGYGINALLDFADPVDMLAHLMIGSEGTLGFISEITFDTVAEHPHKASALVLFDDLERCCRAV